MKRSHSNNLKVIKSELGNVVDQQSLEDVKGNVCNIRTEFEVCLLNTGSPLTTVRACPLQWVVPWQGTVDLELSRVLSIVILRHTARIF